MKLISNQRDDGSNGEAQARSMLAALETARRRCARYRAARRQAHRGRCAPAAATARCCATPRNSTACRRGCICASRSEEMAAAWKAIDPALREALTTAAKQIRGFAKRQMPASWSCISDRRPHHRPARAPARLGRLLCSQRPSSAAFHAADDGDSRAGCGRRAHRGGLAQARARNSGRRAPARHHGVLSPRRRARRRRARLRNRKHCRASTRSSAPAISTSPRPSASSPSIAPSTCSPAPPRSSSPANAATPPTSPPTSSRRPSTILKRWPSSSPRATDLAQEVIAEAKLRSRNNPVAREALDRNGLVIRRSSTSTRRAQITNRLAPEHLTVDCRKRSRVGCRTPARSLSAAGPRSPWATTSPAPITRCPPAAWRACAAASA